MKLEKGMWLMRGLELTCITSIGPKQTGLQHFGADYSFRKGTELLQRDVDDGIYTVVTPDSVEFATCRLDYQKREANYMANMMRRYEIKCLMVSHDNHLVTTESGSVFYGHED